MASDIINNYNICQTSIVYYSSYPSTIAGFTLVICTAHDQSKNFLTKQGKNSIKLITGLQQRR